MNKLATVGICVGLALLPLACHNSADKAWRTYNSGDGKFTIEMPGTPRVNVEMRPTPPKPTEVVTVLLDRGAQGSLQLSHYQLLPEAKGMPIKDLLQTDCMHPFTDSKFVPGAPTMIKVGPYQAMSIVGIAPHSDSLPNGGWEEDRCVIVGQRFYHLIAIGPDNAATRRTGQWFLDSFRPSVEH